MSQNIDAQLTRDIRRDVSLRYALCHTWRDWRYDVPSESKQKVGEIFVVWGVERNASFISDTCRCATAKKLLEDENVTRFMSHVRSRNCPGFIKNASASERCWNVPPRNDVGHAPAPPLCAQGDARVPIIVSRRDVFRLN